jgi:hyperosmotically inducible periplasmic protein
VEQNTPLPRGGISTRFGPVKGIPRMKNLKCKTVIAGLATGLTLAAFTACTSMDRDERSEGRTLDDDNITEKVENKLEREPVYKFKGVEVKTFAGVVQLSGFVNSEEQKRRAEEVANQVDGVQEVINALAIKATAGTPTGRNSDRIYANPTENTNQSPGSTTSTNQTTEPK